MRLTGQQRYSTESVADGIFEIFGVFQQLCIVFVELCGRQAHVRHGCLKLLNLQANFGEIYAYNRMKLTR